MRWLIGGSLLGAAWCITALVLSLVYGGTLPITIPLVVVSALPAAVFITVAAVRTSADKQYRTLHRFDPASRRLCFLLVVLALAGIVVFFANIPMGSPEVLGDQYVLTHKGGGHTAVTRSVYLEAVASATRMVIGVALIVYSLSAIFLLLRMHYRAPRPRH